jgi:hypothetical protein
VRPGSDSRPGVPLRNVLNNHDAIVFPARLSLSRQRHISRSCSMVAAGLSQSVPAASGLGVFGTIRSRKTLAMVVGAS